MFLYVNALTINSISVAVFVRASAKSHCGALFHLVKIDGDLPQPG